MTILQQIVTTLISEKTIQLVEKQFKDNIPVVPLESNDMSFRLFKTTSEHINLELLIQMQHTAFMKPIGYYTLTKGFFTNTVEVTVLKEFEEELNIIQRSHKISSKIKINKLSLIENALISAYSMEAVLHAVNHKDVQSIQINGLDVDILMTYDNEYPQFFLHDKYGIRGHIAAYFFRGQNQGIAPNIDYEKTSHKLNNMGLYSAFKNITPISVGR